MLQLFANNNQLDTSGVSFSLTSKNPMFTEKLEGSYIYSLNLPTTDRNNEILGFPGRLEKHGETFTGSFRAVKDGIEIVSDATITAKKVTGKVITANIAVGLGHIIYNLQDLYLKDIDLGGSRALVGETFVPTDYYNSAAAGEFPEFDFTLFPVFNQNFYDGTNQEAIWMAGTKIVNNYGTGGFETGDPHTLVPFPYVIYLLDRIFREFGYSRGENAFFKNADLKRLVLYNNYADIATVQVEDPGPPITFSFSNKANHRVDLANQVPEYKVLDFLNDLRMFAIGFFVNPYTRKVDIKFLKDIINSTEYDDITEDVISIKSKNNETVFNGYKFAYSLSDDSWGEEYFKNELSDYILKDPVATTLDLPINIDTEVNEVRLVQDIDTYYIFKWDEDSSIFTWVYFLYHFEDLKLNGTSIFNVTPGICPLFVEQLIVGTGPVRIRLLPKIGQPGTNKFYVLSDTKELFVNDPGKRFCFYRGLQQDSLSGSYPLGTPDVYDQAGDKIAEANLSLKWEGEYGLYDQLWRPVINFLMRTKEVEMEVKMTAAQFKNFDYSRKKRISGIDFLMKEMKANFSNNTITATMTCYKV